MPNIFYALPTAFILFLVLFVCLIAVLKHFIHCDSYCNKRGAWRNNNAVDDIGSGGDSGGDTDSSSQSLNDSDSNWSGGGDFDGGGASDSWSDSGSDSNNSGSGGD
jgi:uncharacterized membrane protein YgcG